MMTKEQTLQALFDLRDGMTEATEDWSYEKKKEHFVEMLKTTICLSAVVEKMGATDLLQSVFNRIVDIAEHNGIPAEELEKATKQYEHCT